MVGKKLYNTLGLGPDVLMVGDKEIWKKLFLKTIFLLCNQYIHNPMMMLVIKVDLIYLCIHSVTKLNFFPSQWTSGDY